MRNSGRTLSTLLLFAVPAIAGCRDDEPASPVGTGALVFVREVAVPGTTSKDFDIYRADASGRNARALTRSTAYEDFEPAISPDGRLVAFWRIAPTGTAGGDGHPAGLRVMNVDGSGVRAIGDGGTAPSWSPDGARLAFQDDANVGALRSAVWITDLAGTTRTNASAQWALPAGQAFVHDYEPDWSPDGQWIAFATNRGTTRQRIAIGAPGGTALRYLTTPDDSTSDSEPRWSPDGHAVAFIRWRVLPNGNTSQDVWVVDVLGEHNVTGGHVSVPLGIDWTPDGRLLVGSTGGILRFSGDSSTNPDVLVSQARDPSVRY